MKFEQETPVCTSIMDELTKRILEIKICEFLTCSTRIKFEIISNLSLACLGLI
jgi:hypothetical protein